MTACNGESGSLKQARGGLGVWRQATSWYRCATAAGELGDNASSAKWRFGARSH